MKQNRPNELDLQDINKAIENCDMSRIDEELKLLESQSPFPQEEVDSTLFAKDIIKKSKGRKSGMKKAYKMVAGLALAMIIGVTGVYASGLYKSFSFYKEDKTITVKSTGELTQEEALEMAVEAEKDLEQTPAEERVNTSEKLSYYSIAEAEKNLGIPIAVPTALPEAFEMDESVYVEKANRQTNIYVTFKNGEKLFGITILADDVTEDMTSITITDSVYENSFKSNGRDFNLFTEDGGLIATTDFGAVQYALISMGLTEDELKAIVDSVDLTVYE